LEHEETQQILHCFRQTLLYESSLQAAPVERGGMGFVRWLQTGSDASLNHPWSTSMTDNALHPQQPPAHAPVRLTPRERQVLLWCAYGKSSWEIGRILECKESTVNFHVSNILRKFDVPTRVAAVIKAIRYGMLAEQ
jgi:DNA-binding CsgD family transcriptional regulator